tara:strand:- start:71 stop:190 length:120 start_codon:yes stop_codon:yes gene_type:complete
MKKGFGEMVRVSNCALTAFVFEAEDVGFEILLRINTWLF